MKAIRYLLFFIATMVLFSCNNGDEFYFENLIEKAYTARCTRNLQDINIDSLAIVDAVCMEKKDLRGSCICEGIIGYSKFFERDYLTALVMLKNAESKLQYCDSMSAFVYHYLSEILATEDTVVALQYINKAIEIAIKQENKIDQINAYRQKANLVGVDSARVYIEEASRISIEIDDTIQNMLCWSRYAINYYDKLHPDSIIKFVKPFCEIRPYALDQMVLAEAYIQKGMIDSATYYVSLFEGHPLFQIDKYYLRGKIAEINHNFDNAAMLYRLAYETYDKEINKYLKLQLSGKNTQYDMQQLKIEAQKEKMALFKTIIILLIGIIIVILVLILSYFRTIILHLVLIAVIRFMGKRQIGEMQMSELVAAFMLSELAVMPITDTGIPLMYSILPILLLAVLEILTSFLFLLAFAVSATAQSGT